MSDEQIVVCKIHYQVEPCPNYPVGCIMTQEPYWVNFVVNHGKSTDKKEKK